MLRIASALALFLVSSAASAQSSGGGVPGLPLGSVPNAPYANQSAIVSREIAARQQRYFVFSTGNGGVSTAGGISVPPGDYLNVVSCNVSATKTSYVTLRIFDTSATVNLVYGGIASPAPLSGTQASVTAATTTTGTNVFVGGATSSVVTMTFGVGTTVVNNATANAVPSGVGYIYANTKNELNEMRVVPPGKCFGQYLYNLTAGLGGATSALQFRMYEYEE